VEVVMVDVDSKTNEITRFAALLDQIHDLDGAVITADALHCQRDRHLPGPARRPLDPDRQRQPAQPASATRRPALAARPGR
jgi:predicted transposase YbfD/YdcC